MTEIPYDPKPADKEAEVLRITAACQAVLEDAIRRHPADWVWMHERWKTQPPRPEDKQGPVPVRLGMKKSAMVHGTWRRMRLREATFVVLLPGGGLSARPSG